MKRILVSIRQKQWIEAASIHPQTKILWRKFIQFTKITLALALLLATTVCSSSADAATVQKPTAVQPKQFDDPLFKPKK